MQRRLELDLLCCPDCLLIQSVSEALNYADHVGLAAGGAGGELDPAVLDGSALAPVGGPAVEGSLRAVDLRWPICADSASLGGHGCLLADLLMVL